MPLFRDKKPDDTPFLAPEPENPDEVAAKFERMRSGRSGAARRWLLEKSGLEEYSPIRRFLVSAVIVAELAAISLNFLTDANIPIAWTLGVAVPILTFLLHKNEETEEPE